MSSLCAEYGVDVPDFTEVADLTGPEFREVGMTLASQLPGEAMTALLPDRWAAAHPNWSWSIELKRHARWLTVSAIAGRNSVRSQRSLRRLRRSHLNVVCCPPLNADRAAEFAQRVCRRFSFQSHPENRADIQFSRHSSPCAPAKTATEPRRTKCQWVPRTLTDKSRIRRA